MSNYLGFEPCTDSLYYFVSYNNEDADRVGEITCCLNEHKVPLWYDYGIAYGDRWSETISEKISEAQAVILFFTKGILAKKDSFVYKEYQMATILHEKPVYVVLMDEIGKADVPHQHAMWWIDIKTKQCIAAANPQNSDAVAREIMKAIRFEPPMEETSDTAEIPEQTDATAPLTAEEGEIAPAAHSSDKPERCFDQQAAQELFATADDIPQILVLPDEFEYIASNAFAKLCPNGKTIRQIHLSNTVEVVEPHAFDGLIVTEAVHISPSIKRVGTAAFTLDSDAYAFVYQTTCLRRESSFSVLPSRYRTPESVMGKRSVMVKDIPYRSKKDVGLIQTLHDLATSRQITHVQKCVFPMRSIGLEADIIRIPPNVCVIDDLAFANVTVRDKIVIPSRVTKIGKNAFSLREGAYVVCSRDSYAYLYCQENGIPNSVDMAANQKKGVCQYCGGNFSGLFKKICTRCGRGKDY